ncbi:hypothetical protein EVG20_g5948 [Dentipellis fragilis]|uniref:Uncharacterized protein n=1 Tax=Dentipellis fragilis TaxID=205917 RepID=A0A4Y9YRW0_9AGAM|nr:hypothetical protein EVG20_g5948 [Dentipellis fragilis]
MCMKCFTAAVMMFSPKARSSSSVLMPTHHIRPSVKADDTSPFDPHRTADQEEHMQHKTWLIRLLHLDTAPEKSNNQS